MNEVSLMHAVQSPNAITQEMNIQDPSCAVHVNKLKLFIFYLRVVSPKFTALMVYLQSLLPAPFNILNANRLFSLSPSCAFSRHRQPLVSAAFTSRYIGG